MTIASSVIDASSAVAGAIDTFIAFVGGSEGNGSMPLVEALGIEVNGHCAKYKIIERVTAIHKWPS
jgi:hypothetical protein